MDIFARFGEFIIRTLSFIGMIILSIPKIPHIVKNINTNSVRDRIDSEQVKQNISSIRNEVDSLRDNISNKTETSKNYKVINDFKSTEPFIHNTGNFTSEEKERTVLILQLASGAFIVFAILHIFNFLPSFLIFILLNGAIAVYILYTLFTKIKLMYPDDFNAYRDFFLMYLAVGIIIVLVSGVPSLVMAFSFQSLPSLSVLIYAVIAVVAVFLIFRVKYYRNFTYGTVLEAGENTAHVKVEYDIRSNVKPDVYTVENTYGAQQGDLVKIKVEEKLLSTSGNQPTSIMETVNEVSGG